MFNSKKLEFRGMRDGFGEALLELAAKNKKVVALTANLTESTRLSAFASKFPERFCDVGVAEQNLLGTAVGLALSGKIPFVTSFAVFSPGRNWDQLRVSVCCNRANVKIIGAHAGLSVGPDGATHQALEDLAITRCLPNLIVLAPADYYEVRQAVFAAAKIDGPVYIRFPREKTLILDVQPDFKISKANVLKIGKDLSLIATGSMVGPALLAAEKLQQKNISAEVVSVSTVKPLDTKTILASARKTRAVVTLEEHQIYGGFGSAVAECLVMNLPTPVEFVGVRDSFGESGTAEELFAKYGLDQPAILRAVVRVLKRKS